MAFKRKFKKFNKKGKKTLTKKVNTLVRMVAQRKPEIKFVDVSNSLTASYNGATVNLLSNISQGTGDFGNRIGDKIRVIGFTLRYILTENISNLTNYNAIRVLMTMGKGEAGTALTLAQVIQSTGASASYLSGYNHDYRNKYTVLYDKTDLIFNSGVQENTAKSAILRRTFKKCNFMTSFDGAGTTILDHGLYLQYLTDQSTNLPTFTYVVRVWYFDP